MPIIQPDLSEVQSNVIEPNTWMANITNVETGISKNGNPKIVVHLDVTAQGGKQFKRQSHLIITGKGAFQFEQLLRATGFGDVADAYKNPNAPKPDFDTDMLIGKPVNVVVEADTYNGAPSDKIQQFLAA